MTLLALNSMSQPCKFPLGSRLRLRSQKSSSLYKILGQVIEELYANNLSCGLHENLFDVASKLLQSEQKYLTWQRDLPASLSLIELEGIGWDVDNHSITRFRVILTLRALNLRILTHRPLLSKYLECLSDSGSAAQHLATLRRLAGNSVRICVDSAVKIVKLIQAILNPLEPRRRLLGAWWFSLYYGKCANRSPSYFSLDTNGLCSFQCVSRNIFCSTRPTPASEPPRPSWARQPHVDNGLA